MPPWYNLANYLELLAAEYSDISEIDAALQAFDLAIDIYVQDGFDISLSSALADKGSLLISIYRYDEAITLLQDALTVAEKAKFGPTLNHVYTLMAQERYIPEGISEEWTETSLRAARLALNDL